MTLLAEKNTVVVKTPNFFSLDRTLDCGQCFRFEKDDDGTWNGVAFGKSVKIKEDGQNLVFYNITQEDFDDLFFDYFDLGRDYEEIDEILCRDERFKVASEYAAGIHIMNQEPWETLCSFIISQNNNIPRIKGIIKRLCENFGERLPDGNYTFPSAERVAELSAEDLSVLRAGFRVKYIMDAAKKISSGEVNLEIQPDIPLEQARDELCKIKGVGAKVADCALLFSLKRMDAFPSDVWIKRVMGILFPDGLPEEFLPIAGIAQQYLYHYSRMSGEF